MLGLGAENVEVNLGAYNHGECAGQAIFEPRFVVPIPDHLEGISAIDDPGIGKEVSVLRLSQPNAWP